MKVNIHDNGEVSFGLESLNEPWKAERITDVLPKKLDELVAKMKEDKKGRGKLLRRFAVWCKDNDIEFKNSDLVRYITDRLDIPSSTIYSMLKGGAKRFTPQTKFRPLIIAALSEGPKKTKDVCDYIEKHHKLLPGDLVPIQRGELKWKNTVRWERMKMIQAGILDNSTPKGVWKLA